MFLLATIVSVAWCAGLTEATANCTGVTSGYRCDSCAAVAVCSGGQPSSVLTNCQPGQVCEEDTVSGTGTCFTFDATNDANKCQCDTAPAFFPDPYDVSGARFMVCIIAGSPPILQSCPSGQVFSDLTNSCIEEPIVTTLQPPTCTQMGIFPLPDGCSGYYICFSNGSPGGIISHVVYCNSEETFDPVLGACSATPATLPPKPETCPANTLIVMDAVECNAFYVCDGNGDVFGEALCCPPDKVINVVTMKCEEESSAVQCPMLNPCYTGDYVRKCEMGIFPLPDSCSGYYICFSNGSPGGFISHVVYCNSEETFDPVLGVCSATPATLPPKPETCPANTLIVMDAVECNAFYVCDGNGDVFGEALCCPPDKVINVVTMKCEEESSAVQCPMLNPCYTGDYVRKCEVTTEATPTMMSTTTMTCHTEE